MKIITNKADFSHKLAIKIYMCSLILLLVNLSSDLVSFIQNTHWGWFAVILGISYLYCVKRVVSN